ncbi:MAG: type IX secretion system outer membrane channel protein PorV [Ginsengibacter sp.]
MKQATLKLTALVLLVGGAFVVNGQSNTNSINVVTTAVPFLRISPDARAGGMGDVGIATLPDANSSFWNQAKYPFAVSKSAISVTYTPWLKGLGLNDVYLASLAGYTKIDELQTVSASLRYFSLGNIQFTDNLGNNLQTYRPREFAFDIGYSRKLSDNLGLGIALRYINSNLASGQSASGSTYKTGSAVAGDLSLFHDGAANSATGSGFNWGVAISNLGSRISYTNDASEKDYIPANLGLGIAYVKAYDENNKVTFGLDVNKLLVPTPPLLGDSAGLAKYHSIGVVSSWFSSFTDAPGGFSEEMQEFQISAGAEYSYNDQFLFRAGYFYENPNKGDRQYFTIGAGLNYNMLGLNFSYLIPSGNGINRNPLSNTLRFSIIFNLDKTTAAGTATTTPQ